MKCVVVLLTLIGFNFEIISVEKIATATHDYSAAVCQNRDSCKVIFDETISECSYVCSTETVPGGGEDCENPYTAHLENVSLRSEENMRKCN